MNHAGEWRLVISRWVGDALSEQFRRGARRAALERDERSVAFGVRDGLIDHAPAGRDDPAGEHDYWLRVSDIRRSENTNDQAKTWHDCIDSGIYVIL
jgi:hypothetical protein